MIIHEKGFCVMVHVAILGHGVVGSGVAELISGMGDGLNRKADELLNLKYILDVREFPGSPFAPLFVRDFSVIEEDPAVEIVVETIGGTAVALDFTRRALKAGKSVVTSNKEVVANYGQELMELAAEHGATYLFEASVGGGIPILRPLNQCMAANEILEICGILNGTTNYIFTRMIQGGLSFEAALKEAQVKGYAEQDPTADVEGLDTCRKICILASIAFGWHVRPEEVSTIGITGVDLADVSIAAGAGKKIKLLGRAMYHPDGTICAYVEPHLVDGSNPLAGVEDVFNAVTVRGNATGDVMFYGRGAGKLPTASAAVADVIAIARQMQRSAYRPWKKPQPERSVSADTLQSPWMVRLRAGVLSDAVEISVSGAGSGRGFMVPPMTRPVLMEKLQGHEVLSVIRVLD